MAKFIVLGHSDGIYEALHAVGIVADEPKDVARVVIDLKAGSAAKIYVEKYADDSLIEVIVQGGLQVVAPGDEA